MGTILLIILCIAAAFGIVGFIFSQNADPEERAKEAAAAAGAGAIMTTGCMLQAILAALPVLIGLFLLAMILRSCS